MDEKNKDRRRFLTGVVAGTGLLAAWELSRKISLPLGGEDEMVKLITADGKVVEVAKKHLPPSGGKAISNAELSRWAATDNNQHKV